MRNSLPLVIVACFGAYCVNASAQIKAQGTDTPSYIQFSLPRFEVSASETNAVVTIVRTGDSRRAASVEYSTRENTAEDGIDFKACGGTLIFAAGQNFKTISIPIFREGASIAKSFQVDLEQADSNTIVTTPTAPIEIQPEPPALEVRLKAGAFLISWPDSGLPFELEAQVEGQWTAVTNAPSLTDQTWSVKVPLTAQFALFRLAKH